MFSIGGWKFNPTEQHALKMKMLAEHLAILKKEKEEL
jgi:hypothetical protein